MENENYGGALQPVLNRLSSFFPSETQIHQEAKMARMQRKVFERKTMWSRYTDVANKSFSQLYAEYKESQDKGLVNEQKEEDVQADLIGCLFTANRKRFESGRSARAYDEEKESKQIEGVIRALNGHHLHMGTGAGKSTSVLPIAALVDGFTRGKGRVVVGSATGLLTDEIKRHIEGYIPFLNSINAFKEKKVEVQRIKGEGDSEKEGKSKNLMKDMLLSGKVQPETEQKQFADFWEAKIESTNREQSKKYYEQDKNKSSQDISIFVGEEKDIVFDWMGDRKAFEAECPRIYMDEAHVPFGKKTPYEKSTSSVALSSEAAIDGMSEWMVNYLVARALRNPPSGIHYITPEKGVYGLSEEGLSAIQEIHLSQIQRGGRDDLSNSFRRGVSILYHSIGLQEGKSEGEFFQETLANLKKFVPTKSTGRNSGLTNRMFMESIGEKVARMLPYRGKLFTSGKKGKNTLRDAVIDELLAENQYEPSTQAAVLAIAEKFEPIERNVAYMTSTYESFIHANSDKIVAFSGTLYVPDPLKQTMKKRSFADFLETETKRSVDLLASQEIKPFPLPRLFIGKKNSEEGKEQDVKDELLQALMLDLQSETTLEGVKRPTLIVDNGGLKNVKKTYRSFVEQYGKDRVVLLPPKPPSSDEKESKKFKNKLDNFRKMLSEGQIDFLISSGSAALGVNFEKSDGTFPDLRTVTLGMPESEEKMAQIIGRRRMMEGNTRNHLWYLTMSDLEESISNLEVQKKAIYIDIYKKSQTQMRNALEKTQENSQKTLRLMVDLWHELKKARATDIEQSLLYDDFMGKIVIPRAEEYIKRKVAKEILTIDDQEFDAIYQKNKDKTKTNEAKVINTEEQDRLDRVDFERRKKWQMIELYASTIGLPSTLYSDIQSHRLHMPMLKGSMAFIADSSISDALRVVNSTLAKPSDASFGTATSFDLEGYLDRWYATGKQSSQEYVKRLHFEENLDFCTAENDMRVIFVKPGNLNTGLTMKIEKQFEPFTLRSKIFSMQIVTFTNDVGQSVTAKVVLDHASGAQYGFTDVVDGNPMNGAEDMNFIENMSLVESSSPIKYKGSEIMALKVKYKRQKNTPS